MEFFNKMYEKGIIDRLKNVISSPFQRLTYTEAVQVLIDSKQKFEIPVVWGMDLKSEHERFLCEQVYKKPVILTDYPKEVKSFYMRLNEDGKTVSAMDVLVPKIGEIIGGSQREERLEVLEKRYEDYIIPLIFSKNRRAETQQRKLQLVLGSQKIRICSSLRLWTWV